MSWMSWLLLALVLAYFATSTQVKKSKDDLEEMNKKLDDMQALLKARLPAPETAPSEAPVDFSELTAARPGQSRIVPSPGPVRGQFK